MNRGTALGRLGTYLLVEAAELAERVPPVVICSPRPVEPRSAAARARRRWQSLREDREVIRIPVSVGVRHHGG
jgi:hypothetical protein